MILKLINLQDTGTTAQEMSGIVIGVESNEITVQNTEKESLSNGQDTIDLARWEGSMEEESDLDVLLACADFFTKHLWEKHEMIVLNPDQISILNIFCHSPSKDAVYFLVSSPGRFVKCDLSGVVVKQWPEDGILGTN